MTLLGIGAMASPRYRPAGLLAEYARAFADWQGARRSNRGWRASNAAGWRSRRASSCIPRIPRWARGADLMFADAAGWSRPIRFAGGVGGHAAALDLARHARRAGVRRLVFAHVGRPTLRALDKGDAFPFGELGKENALY